MPVVRDDQRALIGQETAPRQVPYAINEAMARFWCEMVEDANPIYFDDAYARTTWLQGSFAPPAMLFTWGMPPVWPEIQRESPVGKLHFEGCDATIAVNAVQEYFMPLRYGDRLTVSSEISAISDEKTTRLGTGHFVSTLETFRNQHGQIVGTHTFSLFIYRPHTPGGAV